MHLASDVMINILAAIFVGSIESVNDWNCVIGGHVILPSARVPVAGIFSELP
jgi:hypothetical protein